MDAPPIHKQVHDGTNKRSAAGSRVEGRFQRRWFRCNVPKINAAERKGSRTPARNAHKMHAKGEVGAGAGPPPPPQVLIPGARELVVTLQIDSKSETGTRANKENI